MKQLLFTLQNTHSCKGRSVPKLNVMFNSQIFPQNNACIDIEGFSMSFGNIISSGSRVYESSKWKVCKSPSLKGKLELSYFVRKTAVFSFVLSTTVCISVLIGGKYAKHILNQRPLM